MAVVKDNIFLEGLAGSVGRKMVIRRGKDGQTIISTKPRKTDKGDTEAQIENKRKFKDGALYGKSIMADPEKKAMYSADGGNAYNNALRDYMLGPKVDEVDASEYSGEVGQQIVIKVSDDFGVAKVGISIYNPDNTLVEQGLAMLNESKTRWIYIATATNPSIEGDSIVVRISDLPGNKAEKSETL